MNDDTGVPPSPGNGGPSIPKTAGELRRAIEAGEMGGNVRYEGAAAEELEKKRQAILMAFRVTKNHFDGAAPELEAAARREDTPINIAHQLMATALALRQASNFLGDQLNPNKQPKANGAAGN